MTEYWKLRERIYEYYQDWSLRDEIFGIPSILYKIQDRVDRSGILVCPRCGKKGKLSYKKTISKKKYKYRRLYVYHVTYTPYSLGRMSVRVLRWCYLNKEQLQLSSIRQGLRDKRRWRNIEKYFYESLRLPPKSAT